MTCVCDTADETQQLELRAALAANRAARQPSLIPNGCCYNCGDEVEDGHLFCGILDPKKHRISECQQDYERRSGRR